MGVAPIAVPQGLAYVLNSAGDKSNVDFDYLLQTAIRESSLNPEAKAPTSSAVGLFQFLESTWLQAMKEQGPRLGYQKYADAISVELRRRLYSQEQGHAQGNSRAARGSAGRGRPGGGVHPVQWRLSRGQVRPDAERGRTLHRAFPRAAGRREAVPRRARQPGPDRGQAVPEAGQGQPGRSSTRRASRARSASSTGRWSPSISGTPSNIAVDDSKFAAQQIAQSPEVALADRDDPVAVRPVGHVVHLVLQHRRRARGAASR